MRTVALAPVLAITCLAGAARAGGRECDLALDLRGSLVDATQRETFPASAQVTTYDFLVPEGGQLVELAVKGTGPAIAVPLGFQTQTANDPGVLGADPAIAVEHGEDANRPRYRIVLQPSAKDTTVSARWIAVAAIHGGELRLAVPAHADGVCHGSVHAAAGPGATIARVRIDGAASATFAWGDHEVAIAAELAFARAEPIEWVQEEALGDAFVARAITVVAPKSGSLAHVKRAVIVIDNSRSMELVGPAIVAKVMHRVAAALPANAAFEVIAFDRTPARLFGAWRAPDGAAITAAEEALAKRATANGSDLGEALALAKQVLAGSHDPALVVAITDGMLGDVDPDALAKALGDPRDVTLNAIVLDPDHLQSPTRDALSAAIAKVGGGYVELNVNAALAAAPAAAAEWLEPAWALATTSDDARIELPSLLRGGEGATAVEVIRNGKAAAWTAHDESTKLALAPRAAAGTPLLGALALGRTGDADFLKPSWDLCVCDNEMRDAAHVRARLSARHPHADDRHALAVLATTGRVAANRRAMIAGGGPYTRMISGDDHADELETPNPPAAPIRQVATIDHDLLQKVFELQLQPKAFQCYERVLGTAPKLAGTVQFGIEIGRGEVTRVVLAGTGDAPFDQCLTEAAYALVPPLPNTMYDPDDRTIANYPLTFSVRADHHPIVVAGDADSSSPLDIDAIKGGVPVPPRKGPVKPKDAATPLGPLRPSPTP